MIKTEKTLKVGRPKGQSTMESWMIANGKTGEHFYSDKMYSEEDMQEYAEFCIRCYEKKLPCIIAKDWFEQFKKK
jgi:hypothetical protein